MGSVQTKGGERIDSLFFYIYIRCRAVLSAGLERDCIGKLTIDREHGPIAEERRVVTASWKRLGVVSGLRRTSTPSVVGTLFFF